VPKLLDLSFKYRVNILRRSKTVADSSFYVERFSERLRFLVPFASFNDRYPIFEK